MVVIDRPMVIQNRVTSVGQALVWNGYRIDPNNRFIIEIVLPGMSRFWVNYHEHNKKYEVIAWSMSPFMGLEVLASVFGSGWANGLQDVIEHRLQPTDRIMSPPELRYNWKRLVSKMAIRKWAQSIPSLSQRTPDLNTPLEILRCLDVNDLDRQVLEGMLSRISPHQAQKVRQKCG